MIRVTIFNEHIHEKTEEAVQKVYPHGIHGAIKEFLEGENVVVRTCTLDDPECGLTNEILRDTDVLIGGRMWGMKKCLMKLHSVCRRRY